MQTEHGYCRPKACVAAKGNSSPPLVINDPALVIIRYLLGLCQWFLDFGPKLTNSGGPDDLDKSHRAGKLTITLRELGEEGLILYG